MAIISRTLLAACVTITSAAPQSCLLQRERGFAGTVHDPKPVLAEKVFNPEDTSVNTGDLAKKFEEMMASLDASTTKGLNATSPEVAATIKNFVQELDTMAKAKFQASLKETQAAIDAAVAEVKDATGKVVPAKAAADKANGLLVAARKDQKNKLKISENCHANGVWFNQSRDGACKEMEEGQYHEWDVDDALTKIQHCDLEVETCTDLDALIDSIDNHISQVDAERDAYKEKVAACEQATQRSSTEEGGCVKNREDFIASKRKADMQDWASKKDVCSFGTSLQQKCEKYAALMDVIEEARDGKGTAHSEADREEQWNKVMTWKCMLESYAGQGASNHQVLETCKGTVNYKADVGTLEYKSDEVSENMKPASTKFTCQEKSVRINGGQMSAGEESEDFEFESMLELNVTLSPVGAAPFSFCQPNASKANCQGFLCPAEFPAKADMQKASCALTECTIFDCCEGAASGK